MNRIKRVGVLTSGGDAPGMNAAIRAVVRAGINNGLEVYGIRQGYKGMIEGNIFRMTSEGVSGIIQSGGTLLQTARCNEFKTPEGRQKAYEQLKKFEIDSVVAIGGDGSLTGASLMSKETDINFIGIPGTIDNDLYGTDYTIGYDTALNTVMRAVDKIRDTANSHSRVFFVEVMGREAGFIAMNGYIATGAEVAVIPEEKNQIAKVRNYLATRGDKKKSTIILVAEGCEDGSAMEISEKMAEEFPQFDIRISILGHMQRGGSPSAKDRIVASLMGVAAIEALLDNQNSLMIGWVNEETVHVPLGRIVKMNKSISQDYIAQSKALGTFLPEEEKE